MRAVGAGTAAPWRAGNSRQLLRGYAAEDPGLAATAATGAPALIASVFDGFDGDIGRVRAGPGSASCRP
ncbi:hypothetical protein ACFC6L_12725 [Kitasatospora phosalacinea]|uniref:hypothetical protein n=1 Tax=Kitasatospora phosalacinea TaxID=2065 RepID=UPI0035DB6241